MSPEQMMSSRDVDTRSDIWSMGTILYELLTGQTPFVAETLPALGVMIATEQPRPLRGFRPDVPAALEDVVARCLAKRREHRFASVGELAQSLAPFAPARSRVSIDRASAILREAQGQSGNQPPSSSGSEAAAASAPSTLANWGHTSGTPEGRKGTRAAVAIGLAVLVAAGSVGWVLHARDSASPVVAPPSAAAMVPSAQIAPSVPALSATLEAPPPAIALPAASATTSLPTPPAVPPAPSPPVPPAKHHAPPSAPAAPAHSEPKKPNYDDM
jgi:serine/threonine-protein kinase